MVSSHWMNVLTLTEFDIGANDGGATSLIQVASKVMSGGAALAPTLRKGWVAFG